MTFHGASSVTYAAGQKSEYHKTIPADQNKAMPPNIYTSSPPKSPTPSPHPPSLPPSPTISRLRTQPDNAKHPQNQPAAHRHDGDALLRLRIAAAQAAVEAPVLARAAPAQGVAVVRARLEARLAAGIRLADEAVLRREVGDGEAHLRGVGAGVVRRAGDELQLRGVVLRGGDFVAGEEGDEGEGEGALRGGRFNFGDGVDKG